MEKKGRGVKKNMSPTKSVRSVRKLSDLVAKFKRKDRGERREKTEEKREERRGEAPAPICASQPPGPELDQILHMAEPAGPSRLPLR